MELKTYLAAQRGRTSLLAKQLGVTVVTVSNWAHNVRRVPVLRCLEIQAALGGDVACHEMRPDIDWDALLRPRRRAMRTKQ